MKHSLHKLNIINIIAGILFTLVAHITIAATIPEGIQVYQKNMHRFEEHKKKLAADIFRYHNATNIWDQLRQEFVLPHYENSPRVQEQIAWFLDHQEFLQSAIGRATPYLYFILQQVHKRHLPAEVVLLPIMESSYNPFACSPMGAMGIWQMMPGTASGFGIKQNWWYDGRRDVIASTHAALNYLSYLGDFFDGNWLLAMAAYDTGEGNILSAIRRNIRDGYATDYWSLPLAQETQIYIPRLLALATIMSHPEKYPAVFPTVRNAPYLAQIDIGAQIDLKHAAQMAGLTLTKLKQLNPGYSRSATDPHGPFKLVLPIEKVEQFTENLETSPLYQRKIPSLARTLLASQHKTNKHPQNAHIKTTPTTMVLVAHNPSPSTHTIANALENLMKKKYSLQPGDTLYMLRKGEDLQKVADRFHTSVKTLLAINQLSSTNHLLPGKKIIIPTHLLNKSTDQKYVSESQDIVYKVKRNDTIQTIAQKYHTSVSAIRLANLLTNNNIRENDNLLIPPHIG